MVSEHDEKFGLERIGDGTWTDKVQPPAEGSVSENLVWDGPVIELDDGDDVDLDGGELGTPVERIHMSRNDYDAPHTYNIDVEQALNFLYLVPDAVGDDAAKKRWLNDRSAIIEQFIAARYDGEMDGSAESWDYVPVSMRVTHVGQVTADQAYELGYENTKTVDLYNEYDPGTFGSLYLGRLLQEHCAKFSVTSGVGYREPAELSQEDINTEIALRSGQQEIRDVTAMAIAAELCSTDPMETPWLRNLAMFGYADTEGLKEELSAINARYEASNPRLDMMFTWNLNGGDTVMEAPQDLNSNASATACE
jgi:hypothetical protein